MGMLQIFLLSGTWYCYSLLLSAFSPSHLIITGTFYGLSSVLFSVYADFMTVLLFPYRMKMLKPVILIFTPQEPTAYQIFQFRWTPNTSGPLVSTHPHWTSHLLSPPHFHLPTASPSNQELNLSFIPSLILSSYLICHKVNSTIHS